MNQGFLFLDWSGARVSAIDRTLVGDYDEPRRRVRVRRATDAPPALGPAPPGACRGVRGAARATGGPRSRGAHVRRGPGPTPADVDREPGAAAIALFSPHDLRHRRISLLRLRGMSWARIGEHAGQRNLAVTANVYSHVLTDERELDYEVLLVA